MNALTSAYRTPFSPRSDLVTAPTSRSLFCSGTQRCCSESV
ncbi:hypothetical protein ACFTZF_33135 [Streptomyces mirabilis]